MDAGRSVRISIWNKRWNRTELHRAMREPRIVSRVDGAGAERNLVTRSVWKWRNMNSQSQPIQKDLQDLIYCPPNERCSSFFSTSPIFFFFFFNVWMFFMSDSLFRFVWMGTKPSGTDSGKKKTTQGYIVDTGNAAIALLWILRLFSSYSFLWDFWIKKKKRRRGG